MNELSKSIFSPKASIIVPVFNTEEYLPQCIESILSQTEHSFELILVDDGSTDNSPAICDDYSKKDSRVRVFHQDNSGVSAARNKGIRESQSNWLMFVDSDDWLEPDALEQLLSACLAPECQMVFASGYRHTGGKKELIFASDALWRSFRLKHCSHQVFMGCFSGYYAMDYICPSEDAAFELLLYPVMKLYKKENITCPFNEKLSWGEDRLFNFLFCSSAETITFINVPVYHYRKRQASATTDPSKKHSSYLRFVNEAAEEIFAHADFEQMKEIWFSFLVDNLFDLCRNYAMSAERLSEVPPFSKEIKEICENKFYSEALNSLSLSKLQGFNRKLIAALLSKKAYCFSSLYLYLYFLVFPRKNQLKSIEKCS